MTTITLSMLRAEGACSSAQATFETAFPEGCPITLANIEKAQAAGLLLGWAAGHLLPAPARKAFAKAMAPALKAFDEAVAPANKALDEAMATARKAFDEAVATARKAFAKAMATANKAFDEALATALYAAAVEAGMAEDA